MEPETSQSSTRRTLRRRRARRRSSMISPFMRLARMLRRRSIVPPRRVGLRRRLTRRVAVGASWNFGRFVVRALAYLARVEGHLRLLLPRGVFAVTKRLVV